MENDRCIKRMNVYRDCVAVMVWFDRIVIILTVCNTVVLVSMKCVKFSVSLCC